MALPAFLFINKLLKAILEDNLIQKIEKYGIITLNSYFIVLLDKNPASGFYQLCQLEIYHNGALHLW